MENIVWIAVSYENGLVGRMQLAELFDDDGLPVEITDEHIQAEVDKLTPVWLSLGLVPSAWMRVAPEDFPNDHADFRNAWTVKDGAVVVDMDKARDVTRDRLRAERAPILAAKDVELMRAVEGDDKNATALVAAQKQWLRDVTALPAIDAATTPEDLRAVSVDIPSDVSPAHRLVAKRVIIDRLEAAGKLEAARAAIDAADIYTQERWNTRTDIFADDPTAIALCNAIGCDPAVIFAP